VGFNLGVVCLLSRVSRASYKYIHNYFYILQFVLRTTFCRSQNNGITWQYLFGMGQSVTSSAIDVILSPTATSVYFLTAENWYKVPAKIWAILFRGRPWPLKSHSGCATVPGKTDSQLFHSKLFYVCLQLLQYCGIRQRTNNFCDLRICGVCKLDTWLL